MLKRFIALFLAMLLSSSVFASAEDIQSSEKRFAGTVMQFEEYLRLSVEDQIQLQNCMDNFYDIGGFNGMLMGRYCEVMLNIAKEQYTTAIFDAQIISENEDYCNYIDGQIESQYIQNIQYLLAYAKAREAEAQGRDVEALELYQNCFAFFDAFSREAKLREDICSIKYEQGNAALNRKDFVKAKECFTFTARYNYKASNEKLKLIEKELNATPKPTVKPTAKPTVKPTVRPTATPCAHVNSYWSTVKYATCLSAGSQKQLCRSCGIVLKNAVIPKTDHKYTQSSVIKPTCNSQGYTLYKCSNCGTTKKDNYVSTTNHMYGAWNIYSDTKDRRKCSTCSAYEERSIKYGTWSAWSLDAVSAQKGRRQVETKSESKTVYRYMRYQWYSKTLKGWVNSPYDTSHLKNSSNGRWLYKEIDEPLAYEGEVSTDIGVWRMYEGFWYAYTAQGTPAVTLKTTYYRYRNRTN